MFLSLIHNLSIYHKTWTQRVFTRYAHMQIPLCLDTSVHTFINTRCGRMILWRAPRCHCTRKFKSRPARSKRTLPCPGTSIEAIFDNHLRVPPWRKSPFCVEIYCNRCARRKHPRGILEPLISLAVREHKIKRSRSFLQLWELILTLKYKAILLENKYIFVYLLWGINRRVILYKIASIWRFIMYC